MLEIRELTRRFGDITAVDHVSFEVPTGQMTGFVGANGAGKTTTMRMVMGVLGINGGEVLWQGTPITRLDRRTFGYMPEERGLYPKQPILDQLVYVAQLKGMGRTEARAQVQELLERFGLGERTKDHLEKLSLGNQQRVQIIASVLPKPAALILDEPFSGLDPHRRRLDGRPAAGVHPRRDPGPLLQPPARPGGAPVRPPRRAGPGTPGRRRDGVGAARRGGAALPSRPRRRCRLGA